MEIPVYLARFWGGLFMILGAKVVGGGFLGRVIKYTDEKIITITTGYITLLLGLITVTMHNIWVWDLRVAVTILGWASLFKGIEKVAFPDRVNKAAKKFEAGQKFWGIVIFLISGFYYWVSLVI